VAADPFKKVKGLIQKLIERLLAESQAEATKKGFCDTELGKAESNRDARFAEAKTINTELAALEAKRDFLENELDELASDIKNENIALKEATKEREIEKDENLETIKTAKEGFEAVNDALLVLKKFYKSAARAASFVQTEESPVDAMKGATNPGFEGNYKGKQAGSAAIFALLETISSDFDRTVRQTTAAEEKSQRSYIEYMQTAKSSIASKETKTKLDEEDLKTTNDDIATGMKDLQTNMDLLDSALAELEELKESLEKTTDERTEEKADNAKTLEEAKAGLDAVTQAIEVLKDFYEGSFLQAPGGRDGKSVKDLAPEVETGEYKGSDKGKGIIDLLEKIKEDFEAGKNVVVKVLSACGIQKIVGHTATD